MMGRSGFNNELELVLCRWGGTVVGFRVLGVLGGLMRSEEAESGVGGGSL